MKKLTDKLALGVIYRGDTYIRSEIYVWCPGCNGLHGLCVDNKNEMGAAWNWNRSHESPTFTPSLLVNKDRPESRCHSFIRDGQWIFLSDSHHAFAGKTVDMVDLPHWVLEE